MFDDFRSTRKRGFSVATLNVELKMSRPLWVQKINIFDTYRTPLSESQSQTQLITKEMDIRERLEAYKFLLEHKQRIEKDQLDHKKQLAIEQRKAKKCFIL